ncbi:flagellar hook-basal body complex protein FliE [Bacillus sp. FJAT-45350]|uniref:flagellar hook-basal body complex protein FliE n=1 Tax=Bacillus sp. FJAT-45350 TaxID=2011014 RepID=UPI000BB68185|nr:flagellar hook-basal body complex protein FliE [Bacillus sp. FJAT-45350]
MNINPIQSPFVAGSITGITPAKRTPAEAQGEFKAALSNAINNVNELQNLSGKKTQLLAQGKIDNLHDVMITGQKASVALQATVEIRNKAVEAYQEIMRMPV